MRPSTSGRDDRISIADCTRRTSAAAVVPKVADVAHDPFAVARHAFAVHVARKHHKARLGEPPRPSARVIVEAGAAVHDENTRPFAGTVRIDRKKPVESRVAIAVDDRFGLQSHGVLTVMNLLADE